MKNTPPTTVRLNSRAAKTLSEILKLNPSLSHTQIVEQALFYRLIFPQPLLIGRAEEKNAALVCRCLIAEADKLAFGTRKNHADSASLALAFRNCAFVLKRIFLEAKGRLRFEKNE